MDIIRRLEYILAPFGLGKIILSIPRLFVHEMGFFRSLSSIEFPVSYHVSLESITCHQYSGYWREYNDTFAGFCQRNRLLQYFPPTLNLQILKRVLYTETQCKPTVDKYLHRQRSDQITRPGNKIIWMLIVQIVIRGKQQHRIMNEWKMAIETENLLLTIAYYDPMLDVHSRAFHHE